MNCNARIAVLVVTCMTLFLSPRSFAGTGCSDVFDDGAWAVDVFDLLDVLSNWGTPGPTAEIAAPFDDTDVFDLLQLLQDWGLQYCEAGCRVCFADCEFDGEPISHGQTIPFGVCDTCTCLHGEFDQCTALDCFSDCDLDGKPIPHGSGVPFGCVNCVCQHGVLPPIEQCDDSNCHCVYMGETILNGDTLMVGCELVTCTEGVVSVDDSNCP